MATPSVEVPWHQRRSTFTCSSPKLPLRSNTTCVSSSPSPLQGCKLSLLSTSPSVDTQHSPILSGCGTPLNCVSNSNNTFEKYLPPGTQTGSLFRVGIFSNPLLSKCLIQTHLNRILYTQPPTFYNAFPWNVLLNVCVQTHSAQHPSSHPSAEDEEPGFFQDVSKGQSQVKTQDKLSNVDSPNEIVETHSLSLHSQQLLDAKETHEDTLLQAPTDSPSQTVISQEVQSTEEALKLPHPVSVVNPQIKSDTDAVAWQPEDQDNDIIDSGSELFHEYAIHVTPPEEEDEEEEDQYDDCSGSDMESEYESDSNVEEEDDDNFIEFSDESLDSLPEISSCITQQLAPHPKRRLEYMSLLSAESGYFEGSGDMAPSCDEVESDDDNGQHSGDECETPNKASCEAIWKVFEEQAFSPIPCSKKKPKTRCSQLVHEMKTPTKTNSSLSKLCDLSLDSTTASKHRTKEDSVSEEITPHPSMCVKSQATIKPKCVRFKPDSELVEVHHMVAWSYAYRASRKCYWELFARDRSHFKRRVSSLAPILEPCLAKKVASFSQSSSRDFDSHCVFVR